MKGQDTYFGYFKLIVGVAVVGFALATLIGRYDGTAVPGWSVFEGTIRLALEVLRPVILAGWQCVSVNLCGDSKCLQHLLQIVTSMWPLLCVIAG